MCVTWFTPLYTDDWMFLYRWKIAGGTKDFSLDTMAKFFSICREQDNSRISNMFTPFTSVFSPFKEIFPIVNGLFYALLIMLVQKISCNFSKRPDVVILVFAWACLIVFLPWFDVIFIYAFTFNYIWASVVALTFLFILLQSDEKGWTWQRTTLGCIFAFLTAAFHEGFGVPTLCGMGLWMIFRKGRMSWQFWLMSGIIFVTTLVFVISKGTMTRLALTLGDHFYLPSYRVIAVLVLAAIVFTILAFSRTGKEIISATCKRPVFPVCLGIFISSYVIALATEQKPRCYLYGNEAVVVLLLNLLYNSRKIMSAKGKQHNFLYGVAAGGMLILCVIQSIATIYWQKRYGDESREVYSLLEKSDNGIVYYDFKNKGLPPKYTLTMPIGHSPIWGNTGQYQILRTYFATPFMAVLPKVLEDADYSRGEKIGGGAKAIRFKDVVVVPFNREYPTCIYALQNFDVEFNDGRKVRYPMMVFPFMWPSETDTMVYLNFEQFGVNTKDIVSIEYHL